MWPTGRGTGGSGGGRFPAWPGSYPRRSRFDRPVLAYAPGFTADGRFAAVSLILPWSIHHADATYLLARDGDGWRIVLRQFVYFV